LRNTKLAYGALEFFEISRTKALSWNFWIAFLHLCYYRRGKMLCPSPTKDAGQIQVAVVSLPFKRFMVEMVCM